MSPDGRHTTIAAGRAEAARRHGGRVSQEAQVRTAVESGMRDLGDQPPPRGYDYDENAPNYKWRARARNDAARRWS
jgi:hypothetical protein